MSAPRRKPVPSAQTAIVELQNGRPSRPDFDSAPLAGVRCITIFLPVESVSVASRHCAGAGPAPINTARIAVATRKAVHWGVSVAIPRFEPLSRISRYPHHSHALDCCAAAFQPPAIGPVPRKRARSTLKILRIADQRPGVAGLNRGNVGASHVPGNNTERLHCLAGLPEYSSNRARFDQVLALRPILASIGNAA